MTTAAAQSSSSPKPQKRYLDSVWRMTFSEFRDYINGIPDPSMTTIEEALNTHREVQCLPKKYIEEEGYDTVGDIQFKNKRLVELFTALRNGMQPETLKLPFKVAEKEKQLKSQLFKYKNGRINLENAHVKIAVGHVPPLRGDGSFNRNISIKERCFYYWIEAAIASLSDLHPVDDAGKFEFIGAINGTPALDGGMSYFENGYYKWTNKGGNYTFADGMHDLLAECGFSTHIYLSQRRKASILLLNLQTPCAEWQGSAGKTRINLEPYQDLIASTVSKLAYKIPSLHGKHIPTKWDTGLGGYYKPFQKQFLRERHAQIELDKTAIIKDSLTLSGCWYRSRPKMIAAGFRPRNKTTDSKGREIYDWNATREGFTNGLTDVIKELWPDGSVTRESLGIVAKARAFLYLNGVVYPVTFDSKEELARLNITDMIIVEKEGVTDVLLNVARKYRVALVATAGNFVQYVKDLMKLIHELGRINVCVITDYDIHGINMWRNANEKMNIYIKRIGITKDIVTWLQRNGHPNLRFEDVEEEYSPNLELFREVDDYYLREKRIELDSIIQKVGAESFWKYIVYQLETEFPGPRDYRKVVPEPEPEDYDYEEIRLLLEDIREYTRGIYMPKWEEIKESELKEVKGKKGKGKLLHINNKKEEIDKILSHSVGSAARSREE